MLAPFLGSPTRVAPTLLASSTAPIPAGKSYRFLHDPKASCWLETLKGLSTVVSRGKKFNAVVGLAGASFLALKVAMIAGAALTVAFPPLYIGVALLGTSIALAILLSRYSLPKQVKDLQKAAQKFNKDTLPKVYTVVGARPGLPDKPKRVYAFLNITAGGCNELHLFSTINSKDPFKDSKIKMLRCPKVSNCSTPQAKSIEEWAISQGVSLRKTFLHNDQEKTLFANGGDLTMYLKGISPKKKVRVAIQILQKMVTFWNLAYIHRDIKEVNFLVHDEVPYLADFDFASKCPTSQADLSCGTPSHMLITGSEVNLLHADFYALGMTLANIFGEDFYYKAYTAYRNPTYLIELSNIQGFFKQKTSEGLFNTLRLQPQGEAVFNIMKALLTAPQSFNLADLEKAVNELVVN
jgi:serine/threonine protein kinase